MPITPLRTIATTSQTEEDDDWWEDWSIKSPIEALDVDQCAESLLQRTGAVATRQVETQENLADALTKRNVHSMASNRKRKGFVTPERLAKNWMIGLEAAKRTVGVTTQLAVRDFTHTKGGRRLKPFSWILKQKRLGCDVYTDTMHAKCKSLRGNTCCQIHMTPSHFVCLPDP